VDPVAGAYTIERMTDQLEAEAVGMLARIDALGGTLAAIDAGVIQREIQEAAYTAQQAVDRRDAIVVGVNQFQDESERTIELFRLEPALEQEQIARLREVRASRSRNDWQKAIDDIGRAARTGDNLMPPIVAAAGASASLGEIADAMRQVFGEYAEVPRL
jgi:methylmalonyl-CoA mutase N-terminal domain/subunit